MPIRAGLSPVRILARVGEQRRLGHLPLVRCEEENVGARTVHLVGLTRVDGLLLHGLDLELVQFLIEHLEGMIRNAIVRTIKQFDSREPT